MSCFCLSVCKQFKTVIKILNINIVITIEKKNFFYFNRLLHFVKVFSNNIFTLCDALDAVLQGASGMFLDHLIALGNTGSTSSVGKTSHSCPADLNQIKPEHLYSEADLQALKDRQKKDNHNMSMY